MHDVSSAPSAVPYACRSTAHCWTLQHTGDPMSFKFFVGQTVEYTPVGEKTAGLYYKVVRQMPEEEQAFDLRYRIKSEAEAYERNVLERQLSSNVRGESEYATTKPRSIAGLPQNVGN